MALVITETNGSESIGTFFECAVGNVVADAVEHAHRPQEQVGKAGRNSSSVGRGLDAVDNNVSLWGGG